jgi:hypothetical protein
MEKAGAAFDAAQKRFDEFALSSSAKFLGAEPRKALAAALKKNPDNPSQVIKELLIDIGDNSTARHGLKVAFKDLMIGEVQDAYGEAITAIRSGADIPRTLAKRLDKYDLAAQELFSDAPHQLDSMHKVREVMETVMRSQNTYAIGSNTFDKYAAVQSVTQSATAKAAQDAMKAGLFSKFPVLKHYFAAKADTAAFETEKMFKVFSQAVYDPPLADLLVKQVTTPAQGRAVARQMKLRMTPAVAAHGAFLLDYGKQILSDHPSDDERLKTLRDMDREPAPAPPTPRKTYGKADE